MELKKLDGFEYFHHKDGVFNIIFFTAEGNASFNINTTEGMDNIQKIKKLFELEDIGFNIQTHSDLVWIYNGNINKGDAILTNKNNTGLGVFTADCVPVILIDKVKNAIAAIHSGWRGTYADITYKSIKKLMDSYDSESKDLEVFIGPHIGVCCYEVGPEIIDSFNSKGYARNVISKENNLSLKNCIVNQCVQAGVALEKITSIDYCTMCSNEHKFFSYRKNKDDGRLLSLVFIKNE